MINIFKKLTPISAYWLGVLAADGYLTLQKGKYKRVGLAMIDKELKKNIVEYFELLEK